MTKNDLIFAIGEINDDFIEKSEQKKRRNPFGKFGSLAVSAVLILAFSVTAVAAANFFNTLHGGNLAFMEAAGGYMGDIYSIKFNIDVAEDAEYKITDYYVPMFFEENWVDCGGEACETSSVLVYDNYDENLYAIFQQFPAAYHKNGEGSLVYNVPAGTKFRETYFEIDGEKLYCIETEAHDDGFRGDPFGTRILFWSDGYHFFELETRLTMDEKTLREAVRSVKKVDDISDYSIFNEIGYSED